MNEWIVRFDKEQGEDVAVGELIRCKDCKHFAVQYDDSGYYMGNCKYMYIATPNSYCSYAKRKEE